jgi:hypothetical protein
MKYKSISDLDTYFSKRKWYYDWLYYGFYIWWNWIEERPRKIKSFFQRGWRGWADEDTWNFDIYLAKVILDGIKHHKKFQVGIPSEFCENYYDENKRTTKKQDKLAVKEYYKELDIIIKGFKTYLDICNQYKISEEKYVQQQKEVKKALILFIKNFHNLND